MRDQGITAQGPIRWGYAFNQWKLGWQGFARLEDHIRALKITSACGFRNVELTAGSGPWDPTGRPESIAMNFGSIARFAAEHGKWGIDRFPGVFLDPGQFSFEEGHFGLSTTGGTSDARFIHAYCPVAEFGLVGQTMHKIDERVDLADLAALTEIYRIFIGLFFTQP